MRKCIYIVIFFFCFGCLHGQTGGTTVYSFLNLPSSGRIAAMGGKLFAIKERDAAFAIMNPSLLSADMHQGIAFNCVDYFADAVFGHANYVHHFKKVGTFNFGFQFMTYGKFDGYDIYGNETGSFSVGDYAILVGYGREFVDSTFSLGMNLKWILSHYEHYFSTGLAIDIAGSYYSHKHKLCLTLRAVNIGSQIKPYVDEYEKLPFDLQLGFSQRLKHVPIRYSFTLHHLYTWNMGGYTDPTDPFAERNAETGAIKEKTGFKKFADNLFRHFIVGIEVIPVKYVSLQFAYDHNMRQEMRAYEKPGFVGFSYGIGLHIYNINVHYARVHNNLAAVPNYFTISTNIRDFMKK